MTHTAEGERLFERDVLKIRAGSVSLMDTFEATVEDYERRFTDCPRDELTSEVDARVDGDLIVDALVELGLIDPRTIAELCALADQLDPSTNDGWLQLLPVLRLFRSENIRDDGAPEQAIPVPADHLPFLTEIHSPTLTYIWLDDCPPCDSLKRSLESIFEEPQGVSLFAVFGPDDSAFLAREYRVTGGPALLFMRQGAVETRLYGDHEEQLVRAELERLT
ncbi:MAG: thioredoxin family protein [Natronomonas sp.]|uniref:thioredoxin family protein n=1 Tax=Natronomonas sp. TaxID=2184060 RepID=UPI0028700174|nr:thioredoxin family protein [Natronomonas sp.]MDR9431159.1 thioredoxin family protein [Natronomonas sp.]